MTYGKVQLITKKTICHSEEQLAKPNAVGLRRIYNRFFGLNALRMTGLKPLE